MTFTEILSQRLADDGVDVIADSLPKKRKGIYVKTPFDCYIMLEKALKKRQRAHVLAHEAGHHYTGIRFPALTKAMEEAICEHKARKWAAHWLGLDSIVQAYLAGARTEWDIAELLDITVLYLLETLEIFKGEYGEGWHEVGNHWVRFYPEFEVAVDDEEEE